MTDIKSHLHDRICDTEEGSENEFTWAEHIILEYAYLNGTVSSGFLEYIFFEATNEELNDMIEELDC